MPPYYDANVFVFATVDGPGVPIAERARDRLREIAEGEADGCTSVLTWDEVVWAVRRVLGGVAAIEAGRRMLRFPNLRLVPLNEVLLQGAQRLREEHDLDPRDALHAATALSQDERDFISDDEDFERVPGLRRVDV